MVMVVNMRFFFIILTRLTTSSIYELVVDDTVDGKDNLEQKTREVVDIRITSAGIFFN